MSRCAVLLLLAGLCAAGCGRRTILDEEAEPFEPDAGPKVYACGRGKMPCDPDDFGGKTCAELGFAGGDLSCNTSTCNLDLGGCIGGFSVVSTAGTAAPPRSGSGGSAGRAGSSGSGSGLFGGFFGGRGGSGRGGSGRGGSTGRAD